jgi:hypothetical protein
MTSLIAARPKLSPSLADAVPPSANWSRGWVGRTGARVPEVAGERVYLAVVLTSAADPEESDVEAWRAELKLAQCSRALPLAWPLPAWLGDYRDLLIAALEDQRITRKGATRVAWWKEEIREFLKLMLSARDKPAAELIRALTRDCFFANELRQMKRVQALFAWMRPARSLAEALDFRIVTPEAVSR